MGGMSIGLFNLCCNGALEQLDSCLAACLHGLGVPYARLDLAYVGLAQKHHAQSTLPNAAANGVGKLAGKEHLVEGQLATVVAASKGQLAVERLGAYAEKSRSPLRSQSS